MDGKIGQAPSPASGDGLKLINGEYRLTSYAPEESMPIVLRILFMR